MKKACAAIVSALALVTTLIGTLYAVDLRNVLTDYTLTSFSRKDGLAGPVWAIAQDGDGFLWLGSNEGLIRFDGVRFLNWDQIGSTPLPRLAVRSLKVTHDKSLWVGFDTSGGIARIQGRNVRVYGAADGAATGAVTAMAEDRRRRVWVAAANGLFRLDSDRWQRLGSAQGLPEAAVTNVYVDSSDTLWVGTAAGLYWRPDPTDDKFQQIDPPSDPVRTVSLSEDASGRMWTSDPFIGFRTLGYRTTQTNGTEAGRGYRLLHDRSDNLWVGTIGQGLWRVTHSNDPGQVTIEKRRYCQVFRATRFARCLKIAMATSGRARLTASIVWYRTALLHGRAWGSSARSLRRRMRVFGWALRTVSFDFRGRPQAGNQTRPAFLCAACAISESMATASSGPFRATV